MDSGASYFPTRPMTSSETFIIPIDRHSCINEPQTRFSTRLPPNIIPHNRYNLGIISHPCDQHVLPMKKDLLANTTRTSYTPETKERAKGQAHILNGLLESENQLPALPLRRVPTVKHEISRDHQRPVIPIQMSIRKDTPVQSKKDSKHCVKSQLELLKARKSALPSNQTIITNEDTLGSLIPPTLTPSDIQSIVDASKEIKIALPLDKFTNTSSCPKKHNHQSSVQYGCTFPDCYRVFRSRKTWRRHESGQHFQLETWRCHLPRSLLNHRKCAKVFFRAEAFRNHIHEHHKLRKSPNLAMESLKGRIGRNGQGTFWCGFCKEILQLRERAIAAWEERFRHIEGHFTAGDNISAWLCIFTDETKSDILIRGMSEENSRHSILEKQATDLILDHSRNYKSHFMKLDQDSLGEIFTAERSDCPELILSG